MFLVVELGISKRFVFGKESISLEPLFLSSSSYLTMIYELWKNAFPLRNRRPDIQNGVLVTARPEDILMQTSSNKVTAGSL